MCTMGVLVKLLTSRLILIPGTIFLVVLAGTVYGLFEFRGPLRNIKPLDWTSSRLAYINDYNDVNSVLLLSVWIAGTGNQIYRTDDGDGSLTLNLPQDINTVSTPQFFGVIFTDQDVAPNTPGELVYDNTVTGLADGALAWYDDDEVRYLVDLNSPPSNDDYVVAYDANTDAFYMKVDSGGIAWTTPVPGNPDDPGDAGDVAYDTSYLYVCVAGNTWKRAALSTWAGVYDVLLLETGDQLLLETGDAMLLE